MENSYARRARTLAAASLAALAAASCAGNRETVTDRGAEGDDRRASDTIYIDGTGEVPGGMGGTGDIAPMDPTATDTAGQFGDPNAWPTGPLPSDTGIGGAGSPMPDSAWEDTSGDRLEAPEAGGPVDGGPAGNQGPDIW